MALDRTWLGDSLTRGAPLTPADLRALEILYLSPQDRLERTANPALDLYGPGPEGEHCADCFHLGAERIPRHREFANGPLVDGVTEYSCQLQNARTRVTWGACAAYVAAEPLTR